MLPSRSEVAVKSPQPHGLRMEGRKVPQRDLGGTLTKGREGMLGRLAQNFSVWGVRGTWYQNFDLETHK